MKKARQQPSTNEYWDKKLLEAEEKDPNRWKHTGYKKMYVNGSPVQRKSRSPIRKTPVSPRLMRHPQSPLRRRMSRTPERYREKPMRSSPPLRYARKSPPPSSRPTNNKEMYRSKRPMSPPLKVIKKEYIEFEEYH